MKKLLVLGDSPTVNTGFANVVRNLIKQWRGKFDVIDVWGINYHGWPHEMPHKIFPGGTGNWNSGPKLSMLLNVLMDSDYTHLWMLADLNNLAVMTFPKHLRQVCNKKDIHICYYFPVDAPVDPEWLAMVNESDTAATYTQYGYDQMRAAGYTGPLAIIPHGVDTTSFHPLEERHLARSNTMMKGENPWLKKDDILIINVNRNERRKAPIHTIQIVDLMRQAGRPVKLLMHMPDENEGEFVSLRKAARQLGVPDDMWMTNDDYFVNGNGTGRLTEDGLNILYNCADLCLTTSLGEGWGLSMTEALAAGCPVAMPLNTALIEIQREAQRQGLCAIGLPLSRNAILNPSDSSRIRFPVDVEKSAEVLLKNLHSILGYSRKPVPQDTPWSWPAIAERFTKLMDV